MELTLSRTTDSFEAEAEAKTRAFHDLVNAERAKRLSSGVEISVSGYPNTVKVPATEEHRTDLGLLVRFVEKQIAAGDTITPTEYRDADDVMHNIPPVQFVEIADLGLVWGLQVFSASFAIKDMDPETTDHTDDALWPA